MSTEFELHGERTQVAPVYTAGGFDLLVDGRRMAARQTALGPTSFVLEVDGTPHELRLARQGDEIFIHLAGQAWHVRAVDPLSDLLGGAGAGTAGHEVRAPMPGVVISLAKGVGDRVAPGDTILTIESMKLQTAIKAIVDGTVAELLVTEGAMFAKDAILARIEAD